MLYTLFLTAHALTHNAFRYNYMDKMQTICMKLRVEECLKRSSEDSFPQPLAHGLSWDLPFCINIFFCSNVVVIELTTKRGFQRHSNQMSPEGGMS
jgi:hypothetical protein